MTGSTPEEKLLNLIKKDQLKSGFGKDLKIFKKINIVLIGIIGAIAIVFISDTFIFKGSPPEEPVVEDAQVVQEPQPQPKPQPAEVKKIEEAEVADIKKISREEVLGNFNLLGIITGDNKQAIIEDKGLKKTFFLYKGDMLGELKVYDIKDSAVVLEYKGDRIELSI